MRWRLKFWAIPKEYTESEYTTLIQIRKNYIEHILSGQEDFLKIPRWLQFETTKNNDSSIETRVPLCNTNNRDYDISRLTIQFGNGEIAADLQSAASELITYQYQRNQKFLNNGYSNDPINMVCCTIIDFLREYSQLSDYNPHCLEELKKWSCFIESLNENRQLFYAEDSSNDFRQILAEIHSRLTHSDFAKKDRCIEAKIQAEIESRTTRDLLNELIRNIETIKSHSIEFFMTLLSKEEVPKNFNDTTLQKIKCTEHSHQQIKEILENSNVGNWVNLLHESLNNSITHSNSDIKQIAHNSQNFSLMTTEPSSRPVIFRYQFHLTPDENWRCVIPCLPETDNFIMEQLTTNTSIFNQYFKCMGLLERLGILYKEGLSAHKLSGSGGDILLNLCTGGAINQYNADVQSLLSEIQIAFSELIKSVRTAKNELLRNGQANLIPRVWEANLRRALILNNKIDQSIKQAQTCNQKLIDNTEKWQKNPQLLLNNVMQEISDFSQGIHNMHQDLLNINIGHDVALTDNQVTLALAFNKPQSISPISNSQSSAPTSKIIAPAQQPNILLIPDETTKVTPTLSTRSSQQRRYGL